MNRILLSTALVALLSAHAAEAGGLVPGSDTATRSRHSSQDVAVATGTYGTAGEAALGQTRTFGYPSNGPVGGRVPGSAFFDDAASDRAASGLAIRRDRGSFRRLPSIDGRLVPGSDSF